MWSAVSVRRLADDEETKENLKLAKQPRPDRSVVVSDDCCVCCLNAWLIFQRLRNPDLFARCSVTNVLCCTEPISPPFNVQVVFRM